MAQTARLFVRCVPAHLPPRCRESAGSREPRPTGTYWYANLMLPLSSKQARLHETAQRSSPSNAVVRIRFAVVSGGRPLERIRGDERPVQCRPKRCSSGGKRAVSGSSVDWTRSFSTPTNLYGPRDNYDLRKLPCVPALIRKMIDSPEEIVLWERRNPDARYLRRRLRRGASASRPSGTTWQAVNLGDASRDVDSRDAWRSSPGGRFHGQDQIGHVEPNVAERRSLDPSPSC
jgi:hypothetical protein